MKNLLGLVAVVALVLGTQVATAQPGSGDNVAKARQLVQRGLNLKTDSKYNDAEFCFAAAALLDDRNVRAHTELAWTCNHKGDYTKALVFANQAMQIDKNNGDAYREAGYALWRGKDRPVPAAAAFTLAIDLNPLDRASYNYLESLLREQGLFKQADEIRAKRDRVLNGPKLVL